MRAEALLNPYMVFASFFSHFVRLTPTSSHTAFSVIHYLTDLISGLDWHKETVLLTCNRMEKKLTSIVPMS